MGACSGVALPSNLNDMKLTFSALFFLAATLVFAQEQDTSWKQFFPQETLDALRESEDTLALLAYGIVNDSFPEHRFGACRRLIPTLVNSLKTPNSFHYPFERLLSISIMYPPDSSFRIFSWQLYVDKDEYRYYGAIQMNTPELKLYPLVDRSFEMTGDLEQLELTPEQWYGMVYYNVQQTDGPDGRYYLLFGFDAYSFFRKRKVIDVLRFREDKPVFGAEIFRHEEGEGRSKVVSWRKRRVLEYSAAVSVRCNFDPALEIIIYDHLLTMPGQDGEGTNNYPDGSYEGYLPKDGVWYHVNNVFNQTQDEAPRPFPVLDERKKDILGRNK